MGNFGNKVEQELVGQFQAIDKALAKAWELFQEQLERAFEEEAKEHCVEIRKSIQSQFAEGHLQEDLFYVIVERFLEQVNPVLGEAPSIEVEETLLVSLRVLSQAKIKSIVTDLWVWCTWVKRRSIVRVIYSVAICVIYYLSICHGQPISHRYKRHKAGKQKV